MFLYLVQFLLHLLTNLNGVGTCLLGNNQTNGLTTVGFLIQSQVFDGVLDGSDIADEDLLSFRRHGDHKVLNLAGLDILGAHLHLVLLLWHFDCTGGEVEVVGLHHLSYLLDGQSVRIQFLLVDIDIYIAVRCTGKGYITNSVHLVKLRNDFVIEDFIQSRVGLVCRDRVLGNRHSGSRELEDHRRTAVVRQVRLGHIHIRADIVHRLVHVGTPFEFEHDHGHIILRLRGDMLEVVHRSEGVLHVLGHVGLHLGR